MVLAKAFLLTSSLLLCSTAKAERAEEVPAPGADKPAQMAERINLRREAAALPMLLRSPILDCAAQSHAVAMARTGVCNPVVLGRSVFNRVRDCGATQQLALGASLACGHATADMAVSAWASRQDGLGVILRPYAQKAGYGWHANFWVFVTSDTDPGPVGWGESGPEDVKVELNYQP